MLSKMLRGSVNNTTNPAAATDANFNQVSLLLHGDGTNGAQNNTFLDSSTNNFTITRNGNTTQGTNTPFSQAGGYWSNYNAGNGNYLTTSTSAALKFGTGDFTIECWVYPTDFNTYNLPISTNAFNAYFGFSNAGYLTAYCVTAGSDKYQTSGTAVTKNQWNHIAFTRSSGTLYFFVNGSLVGTFASWTYDFNANTGIRIGESASYVGNYALIGYISNVRINTGTALYTSSFTPSTTPLTAVSGTSLLTCQSNYFKDNSSNNFTLTATGTPSVQPFSPFAPTSAYSTSVNGGSEYFDGTGDYLTVATNAAFTYGVSDFTMECWVYLTTTGAIQYVIDQRNSGTANAVIPAIYVSASNVLTYFVSNAAQITGTTALKANAWYHVAVSRATLSTKMFLNGVQEGSTYTDANSYVASRVVVSSNAATAGNYLTGYTSDVRLVNGTAVYTTTFTPPTAPLTAITNTSLLLSGTNAGIYDNAIKNDLETVGSAQVSTSVVKYGTGSMKFNGTTDYLTTPTSPNLDLNAGNFTIEGWFYFNSVASGQQPVSGYTTASNENYAWYMTSTGGLAYYLSSTGNSWNIASNVTMGTVSANTWNHIALVRNGSTFTPYINGVAGTTSSSSSAIYSSGTGITLGAYAGAFFFNGYIDDLRITKGVARYTANFTPPTAAFPNN